MKYLQLSKLKAEYLVFHLIGGFDTTLQGIRIAYKENRITTEEYIQFLERNSERLIHRFNEFIAEASKRATCIFFAITFAYLQVNGEDMDLRRSSRVRTRTTNSRTARARKGKRDEKAEGINIETT